MSGMEMLMKNIMQAAGLDPEKVKVEIQQYGAQLAEKIASMDRALADLKASQEAMRADIAVMAGSAVAQSRKTATAGAHNGAAQ